MSREEPMHLQESANDLKHDNICHEDVMEIKNPAYLTRGDGCIVEWNSAFEEFTNFPQSEVDSNHCYGLIDGIQEIRESQRHDYKRVCSLSCKFRLKIPERKMEGTALRRVWINSYDMAGNKLKRLVDMLIFPFQVGDNIFVLHILLDKRHQHNRTYFHKEIARIAEGTEDLRKEDILFDRRIKKD